jgi:periplasmic protein TonB
MAMVRSPRHKVTYTIMLLAAALLLTLLVWGVRSLVANKPRSEKRQVPVVVKIIRPPQPPPEPPPPPPPEKVPEQIPQDRPEEKPVEQAPQSAQLGVDAAGTDGGDSFGLVGRAGGRDLVGSGNGPFVFYASMVKDLVSDALSNVDRIRRSKYSVNVRVWIAADGHVERVALAESTGNRDLDGAIELALTHAGKVREAPPLEMPQPITLRIVSHG